MSNKFNFNHRVILQKEIQNKGDFGEINSNFETIAEVWAKIVPTNVSINVSKMKKETEITHLIEIRYRNDVKDCKKILFSNRTFNVISVVCPEEKYENLIFNVNEVL